MQRTPTGSRRLRPVVLATALALSALVTATASAAFDPTSITEVSPGAPETIIDKGPRKQMSAKRAKFKFSSSTAGASFECALDEEPFGPCESPLTLKRIKPGKHVFSVRAIVGGAPDPSPATYKFKRKKPSKR